MSVKASRFSKTLQFPTRTVVAGSVDFIKSLVVKRKSVKIEKPIKDRVKPSNQVLTFI